MTQAYLASSVSTQIWEYWKMRKNRMESGHNEIMQLLQHRMESSKPISGKFQT
jgi:hypothetical protein